VKRVFHFNSPTEKYHCDAVVVACFDHRFDLVLRKFLKRIGIVNPDLVIVAGGAKSLASPHHEGDRVFLLEQAVFHFLTAPAGGAAYKALLARTVPVGGHAVIATFALDGPQNCSGLEVHRYDGPRLSAELGSHFALLKSVPEIHVTPRGKRQLFQYSAFRRV